jgi:phospholipase/carboxylesterase
MSGTSDAVVEAITQLLPRLLGVMDRLTLIARHMHPPRLAELVGWLGDADTDLSRAQAAFRAVDWPEGMDPFRDQLDLVASHVLRATEGLRVALTTDNPVVGAYRAMQHATRATEALYPITAVLPTVSQYFLEPDRRSDTDLLARLRAPAADTGVMHADNETGTRGGFSVYVPEYYDPARPWPLIMALHGGAGHGRLFLWSWVTEARSRGAIVIAPTATGDTWALMDPAADTANFTRILDGVRTRWRIDPARLLLTGMSDGGTFTLLAGLDDGSPFTHLAPVAASFHPLLLSVTEPRRISGLPILLTHGALDWMFPVGVGRTANRALTAAGARVMYREIEDLSHAYPRDRNGEIMDWFLAP